MIFGKAAVAAGRSAGERGSAFLSILMYHQVGRFAPMRAHRANYCDHRRFARQMAFLHGAGFRVLDLDTALSGLRGERPIPPRAVVLTFDDGYENFADQAWPVLQKYAFPAVVYVIGAFLGRHAEWFAAEPGRPIPRLLDAGRLRELQAAGLTLGSHTAHHVKLGEVSPATRRAELAAGRAILEDRLGTEVRHLCYPFGSFDRDTVQAAQESGYVSAMTCLRGAATPEDHPLILPRKAISFGDNLLGYAWKLWVKQAPKPMLREWRRRMREHS